MPARGGGAAAHADAEKQAALDAAELSGPYRIADQMGFDEIIDPRELRNALLDGLQLTEPRTAVEAGPRVRRGPLP